MAVMALKSISDTQLEHYQQQGFLVLQNFVSAQECRALRARAAQLVAEFDPQGITSIFTTRDQNRDDYFLNSGDQIRFFFEEEALQNGNLVRGKAESINKIGHALHDLDPVFSRFSRLPELAALAADIGYQQPLLLQSMYIFKQPGIGGEVNCHQDATFLYTEPMSVVGFWFALEDATRENGCLWALPGGHALGLKSRFKRLAVGGTGFEIYDESPWPTDPLVPIEVPQGSLVVLHGLLPHMSFANRSAKSRQAYTLHIVEADADYPADNWLRRAPEMPPRGFSDLSR
jgi:phytanoyl-CoA hydroxylase